jgi:ribose/xylose/arabinose/galactoside ABC-type transport system permease subunit
MSIDEQSTAAVVPSVPAASRTRVRSVRGVIGRNGLLIFFAVLLVVFAAFQPELLSTRYLMNTLLSASVVGILAVGQTFAILTGGFDLSVARTAVAAGIVVALTAHLGPAVAIPLALVTAVAVGVINGLFIARARVNPFVVTLGMYTVLGSVALLLNNGGSVVDLPDWLTGIALSTPLGVSMVIWWFIVIAIAAHVLLSYTRFGRHTYAVGGNLEASRLAGIRANGILLTAYLICALIAGLAGIILTSRLQTASPVALPAAELNAIAAVIIGGTRLGGGFGSIPRTVLGVLILTSLSSALVLLGVASYWQGVFQGAVIVIAVAVDVLARGEGRR